MRTLRTLLPLLGLLLVPGLALAQTGTLSGTITDAESGDPLPGANVLIVETASGAAADIDGNYTITGIPTGSYTVRVTFIGFKSSEQAYSLSSGSNTLDVALAPDYTGLEEVVVTGIASSTSKARAEVAVSRVDASKLQEQNSYQDISQLLNGKVAGVSVQPSSGNVGGGIRFVMRSSTGLNGSGQPVIYVDGVRVDNAQVTGGGLGVAVGGQGVGMLANLNPEDIESIDILKGPAGAALYGTSGSNGVVLITTKRGKLAGGGVVPFNVNYKGVFGANQQFEEYTRETAGTPETANAFFRDGQIAKHSISLSGGSDDVRYFTSYEKSLEEGHINNNAQDRQSFRANFEAFPVSKVTVRANAGYTLNEIDRPQNDNNIFGYLGNTLLASSPFIFTDSTAIENLTNRSRITRFLASAEVEYQPIENLRLRASVGFDGTDMRADQTYPSNLSYSGRTNGERNIFNRRNEQYTYDFNARYSYNITPAIEATSIVGTQAFNRIWRISNATKQNFSTELITNLGAGADFITADEDFLHQREAGVFGQQELAFQNKIFLTLGVRRDFASTVGEQAPAIWYPKASLALRMDQMINLPRQVNFLKFRAAYGETGQLPGLLDGSFLRWAAEPSGYGAGAVLDFIGNVEIEPERIRELELGLESELFNNVGLELTYYKQWAKNSIIDFENAPSSGQTASDVPFNVGESQGWGIEASLTAAPIQTRNFGLDFGLIWNYAENEVQDLGGAQPIFSGFDTQVIKEGLPRDAFYTWSSRATFNDDGTYAGAELTTTDEDGDGEPDRQFFGLPYPDHSGSFTANVRFLKNFNLSGLFDWSLGLSVYNNTFLFSRRFGAYLPRNIARVQIGQLEPCQAGLCDDNDNVLPEYADITEFSVGSPEYIEAAEVVAATEFTNSGVDLDGNWIEEADFIKLREISLRYDFTDLIRKAQFSNYVRSLSITLSARNLWMSTKYSGPEPEVNFTGARSSTRSSDFLTLPQPRVLYFTINVGL